MSLIRMLHALMSPHCEECAEEAREAIARKIEESRCDSCEVLKNQLDLANRQTELFLRKILPEPESAPLQTETKPIPPRHIPWAVKQQMLEAEDRVAFKLMQDSARLMRESKNNYTQANEESIKELEKELGV